MKPIPAASGAAAMTPANRPRKGAAQLKRQKNQGKCALDIPPNRPRKGAAQLKLGFAVCPARRDSR